MKTLPSLTLLVLTAPLLAVAGQSNILTNGDFEEPYVEQSWRKFDGGSSFPGWRVGGHSVDIVSNVGHESQPAASGRQSMDLNGFGPGWISQDIRLCEGVTYDLSFAMAGNVVGPGIVVTMDFLLGEEVIDVLQFDTTGHSSDDFGWEYHDYTFLAESDSAVLTFRSLSNTARRGPALDDVVVWPQDASLCVPEASTSIAAAALLGVFAATAYARRRRAV